MTETDIIILVVWLIGVYVAWFQIRYWNKKRELYYDAVTHTLLSLWSWCIYPLCVFGWLYERLDKNRYDN